MVDAADENLSDRNLAAMVHGFARFGVDTDALLREFGERAAGLGSSEALLLWNRLYVERFPPLSAVFVGAETPFGRWEVVDFLAACYPTVGESFRHIGPHFRLINPHVLIVSGNKHSHRELSHLPDFFFQSHFF